MDTSKYFSDREAEEIQTMETLLEFFREKSEIVSLYSDLVDSVACLKKIVDSLNDEGIRRSKLYKANEGVKTASRIKVARNVYIAECALRAMGRKNHIDELLNLTAVPISHLERTRFISLRDFALGILDLLKKNKDQLSQNGTYKQEDISSFESLILEYKSLLSTIDVQHATAVESSTEIKLLFSQAKELMKLFNDLIDSLMDKQPEFRSQYKQMRKTIHYGIRHKKKGKNPPETKPPETKPPESENPDPH